MSLSTLESHKIAFHKSLGLWFCYTCSTVKSKELKSLTSRPVNITFWWCGVLNPKLYCNNLGCSVPLPSLNSIKWEQRQKRLEAERSVVSWSIPSITCTIPVLHEMCFRLVFFQVFTSIVNILKNRRLLKRVIPVLPSSSPPYLHCLLGLYL